MWVGGRWGIGIVDRLSLAVRSAAYAVQHHVQAPHVRRERTIEPARGIRRASAGPLEQQHLEAAKKSNSDDHERAPNVTAFLPPEHFHSTAAYSLVQCATTHSTTAPAPTS